jgi:hypothetical protein
MNTGYAKMKDVGFLVRNELSEFAYGKPSKSGLLECREEHSKFSISMYSLFPPVRVSSAVQRVFFITLYLWLTLKAFMGFKVGTAWEKSARTPDWCLFRRCDNPFKEKPPFAMEIGVSQVRVYKTPRKANVYRRESLEEKACLWLLTCDDDLCRLCLLVDISNCEKTNKDNEDQPGDLNEEEQGVSDEEEQGELSEELLEAGNLVKEEQRVLGAGCIKVTVQLWRLNEEKKPMIMEEAVGV